MNTSPIALEALLRERAWLRRLAQELVPSASDAEQVADEAIADAAVQARPARASVRAWLRALIRKKSAASWRSAARRTRREIAAARREALPSALDSAVAFEVQRAVADAVAALAEPYRTTILWRYWEDLPPREIARRMNCPVETVQTRIKRAHAQLIHRLDQLHQEERRAWTVPLLALGSNYGTVPAPTTLFAGVLLMNATTKLLLGAAAALMCLGAWFLFAGSEQPELEPAPALSRTTDTLARSAVPVETARLPIAAPEAGEEGSPAEPLVAPRTFLIRGRLLADEDRRAIAATKIAIYADSQAERLLPFRMLPDDDGRFEITCDDEEIPLGSELWIYSADRAPLRYEDLHKVLAGATESEAAVDLGDLFVARGTQLRGRFTQSTGTPIAHASLWVPRSRTAWGALWHMENMLAYASLVGSCDAAGNFELEDRLAPHHAHILLFAASEDALGWVKIEPTRSGLPASAPLHIVAAPSGAVRVQVVDERGNPRAGCRVFMRPRFSPLGVERGAVAFEVARDPRLAARFEVLSDVDGIARFAALPCGWSSEVAAGTLGIYDLRVEGGDLAEQRFHRVEVLPDRELSMLVPIELPAVRELIVRVRDELQCVIAGAVITAYGAESVEAKTDAAGEARLLVKTLDKLEVWSRADAHMSTRQSIDLETLVTGQTIELRMDRSVLLEGRVTDGEGAPAAGLNLFSGKRHLGITKEDGSFRIENFPLGLQELIVPIPSSGEGGWTGVQEPKQIDASAGPVHIVMQRRHARALRVTLVEQGSGVPLEAQEHFLMAMNADGQTEGVPVHMDVDALGLQTDRASSGRWRLGVRATTGQRGERVFDIPAGVDRYEMRMELPPTGTIEVHVLKGTLALPEFLILNTRILDAEAEASANYTHAGIWSLEEGTSERVANPALVTDQPWRQGLRWKTAENRNARLLQADTAHRIAIEAFGAGIRGRVEVRAKPGVVTVVELPLQRRDK